MNTLDQGTKCIFCVKKALVNQDMSTSGPVQDGVNAAKTAVVVMDGQSMCVEHLHERLTEDSMEAYIAAIERHNSGRRS
jgi:hypothetical protein